MEEQDDDADDWSHLEVGEEALTDKHPDPLKPGETDVCVMRAAFPDDKIKHATSVGWLGRVTKMRGGGDATQIMVFETWMALDDEEDIRPIKQGR